MIPQTEFLARAESPMVFFNDMKQVVVLFLAIALAGFFTTGCDRKSTDSTATDGDSTATFDLTAIKKIIEEKNKQFTRAHITGDTTFLNNIFTQDAKVFAPNAEAVIGRSAIAALNLEYVQFGIKEFREETTALYGCEDYVIDEGHYLMIYGKDDTIEKGKYLNVWKMVNGDWKLYHNMWNTDLPATPTE